MIHPAEQTRVSLGNLELALFIPDRGEYQTKYNKNWEVFCREYQNSPPALQRLDLHSTATTRRVTRQKELHSTYLLYDEIGRGEFGTVYKAGDHLSGYVYAAKQFCNQSIRMGEKCPGGNRNISESLTCRCYQFNPIEAFTNVVAGKHREVC